MSQPAMTVTYWGTTGTIPVPLKPAEVTAKIVQVIQTLLEQGRLADLPAGPDLPAAIQQRVEEVLPFHGRSTYGGNTTCVEVQTPDALVILDCGTGFRELGCALQERWNASGYQGDRTAHVLITHPHMDHTLATPFFSPYYDPRNRFSVWGSRRVVDSLAAVFNPNSPMSQTYFPPTFDLLTGLKDFHPLETGVEFTLGSTRILTHALHHPGGCMGYRLESGGRSFVFATDHEQEEVPDRALADFARGADLFYTEGQYLLAEYEGREAIPGEPVLPRRGWGHSPMESCVTTALAAGVRQLHIGHREPRRSDSQIAAVERRAQRIMREELRRAGRSEEECSVLIPYEGLTVKL